MTEGFQCNKCKKFIPKFKPAPKKEAKEVSKSGGWDSFEKRVFGATSLFSYTVEATTEYPTSEKKDTISIDLCQSCAKKLDAWLRSS